MNNPEAPPVVRRIGPALATPGLADCDALALP